MFSMVRSYVFTHINGLSKQSGLFSSRAQAVQQVAENIAIELEGWDTDIQMNK